MEQTGWIGGKTLIKMKDMTELEIDNFALNFRNLIDQKNEEISNLKSDNRIMENELIQLRKPGKLLSETEIRQGMRPVFVRHIPHNERFHDFYAVPLEDGTGVIGPTKGVYRYENYLKTWEAFSEKPTEEAKS